MSNDDRSALNDLDAKLRKARAAQASEGRESSGPAGISTTRQIGAAYRIFVELLAGVLVGAGLGRFLDGQLGTLPWLLLALLLLGFAAGMLNAIRSMRNMVRDTGDTPDARKK